MHFVDFTARRIQIRTPRYRREGRRDGPVSAPCQKPGRSRYQLGPRISCSFVTTAPLNTTVTVPASAKALAIQAEPSITNVALVQTQIYIHQPLLGNRNRHQSAIDKAGAGAKCF